MEQPGENANPQKGTEPGPAILEEQCTAGGASVFFGGALRSVVLQLSCLLGGATLKPHTVGALCLCKWHSWIVQLLVMLLLRGPLPWASLPAAQR